MKEVRFYTEYVDEKTGEIFRLKPPKAKIIEVKTFRRNIPYYNGKHGTQILFLKTIRTYERDDQQLKLDFEQ